MFKVQPNKTIKLNNQRFIARGVQMFDYLLCSFEPNRINYNFRRFNEPSYAYPNANISEPTYYARLQYIDSDNVRAQIKKANDVGCNLIRISIEPAIRYASVEYVDPVDSQTYPPDIDMLDVIIAHAESFGMAVQLQNSNDTGSVGENTTFLAWLADRYKDHWNVWINPANELNGFNNGGVNVNNVSMWETAMTSYVNAIRGAGFENPICLDPCGWAERLDLVDSVLKTNPVFKNDPNLIIQPHYYPKVGENDFRSDRLPTVANYWANFMTSHCILVGEVGIDNQSGRLDPDLDSGVNSVSLTNWNNAKLAVTDFLKWANEQTYFTPFNGCIGHMWKAHSRVSLLSDDNSMHKQDGSMATWGTIYQNNFLSPPVFNVASTVTGMPELLGPPIGNGSIGTPQFQAEGKAGVRAAGAFITPNAWSPILGFLNRSNSALLGLISGNGSGVTYGTSSDYRLKEDIATLTEDEIISFLDQLSPVMATWKDSKVREPVFIAHEVQKVLPNAVSGEKDGEDYQTVDYAKVVPILTAAIQYLMRRS